MKIEWFKDYVKAWPIRGAFQKKTIDAIANDLKRITEILGGEVYGDIDESVARVHALRVCSEGLNYISRRRAHNVRKGTLGPVSVHLQTEKRGGGAQFVVPAMLQPKVDLNTASREELESRLGLSAKASKRVVEYRTRKAFQSLAEVVAIKDLGDLDLEKLSREAYVGKLKQRMAIFLSPTERAFLRDPSFSNYLRVLSKAGAGDALPCDEDLADRVGTEVHAYRLSLEALRRPGGGGLPGCLAEDLREIEHSEVKRQEVERNGIDIDSEGVLLDDAMYPAFITRLIGGAKKSVWVIMFFARFEDEPDYPTDALFHELVEAKRARALDVRVILDADAEDSVIGSRSINKGTYEYLRKSGVAVTFDTPEKYTHSKLIIVDSESVVVGSHNWTAGSFYAYQDTSVFIRSATLSAFYQRRFENFWQRYWQTETVAR